MGFKLSVVSGVLSTLIAAILTWLFGFSPNVLGVLWGVTSRAWWAVTYSVQVPTSVLVLTGFILLYLIYRLRITSEKLGLTMADMDSPKPMPAQSELSKQEFILVKELAAADGRWLGIEHISSRTQASGLLRLNRQLTGC